MEKNNSAFIWEGRGGSDETKNSLTPALRRSWCGKEWVGLGALVGSCWGVWVCVPLPPLRKRRKVSHEPTPHHTSFTLERSG